MVFKPPLCRSRWEGLAACSWIVLIDLLLIVWMLSRAVDWLSFLLALAVLTSLPLLARLAGRTLGAFNLEYWIDRNAVTVRWALARQVIPLTAIRQVIVGSSEESGSRRWLDWPAPYVRPGRLRAARLQLYATRPLTQCLLLDTGPNGIFALSPADSDAFLWALQEHNHLGPTHILRVEVQRLRLCARPIDQDRFAVALLLAGFLGTLLLFGTLAVRYPSVQDVLAFHYNRAGVPDVVRPKSALFLLPAIGLLAWAFNGLWGLWLACRQEQVGAYLLWSGTIIVQIFLFLALLSLIR